MKRSSLGAVATGAAFLIGLTLAGPSWAADGVGDGGRAAPIRDADGVLACMRANLPQSVRIQTIELEAVDRTGSARVLRGRLYARRDLDDAAAGRVRAMLRIDAPDYLAGAAYLVRELEADQQDGMYVYLPSVRRVRRVSGDFADGALLGTDFSYYDFKQIQSVFGETEVAYVSTAEHAGRSTYVLEFRRSADARSPYSLIRSQIDQQTCVPLQTEFYEGETVRKRFSASVEALQQAGGHWYLTESRMDDLKERTHTLLRILDVRADEPVPGRYFNPNLFYEGG